MLIKVTWKVTKKPMWFPLSATQFWEDKSGVLHAEFGQSSFELLETPAQFAAALARARQGGLVVIDVTE